MVRTNSVRLHMIDVNRTDDHRLRPAMRETMQHAQAQGVGVVLGSANWRTGASAEAGVAGAIARCMRPAGLADSGTKRVGLRSKRLQ